MKSLFFFIFNLSLVSFSQSFQPLKAEVPKRFQEVNDIHSNDYFFYSIKTDTIGDSIIFNQYFREGSVEVEILCPSWGGGWSFTGDTTWLGRTIVYDTLLQTLEFTNDSSDQLLFDFSLALGDSALFYSDANNDYYMVYTALNQETILGQLDWVKTFEIHHFDNGGNFLNTDLNGFEMKLGDTLGLINFIDCKNFPQQEIGVTLMGQLHPTIGVYQMTYDEAFPWNVGDELGYVGYYSTFNGGINNKLHRIMTITNRIETSDSVKIYMVNADSLVSQPSPFPPSSAYYIIDYPNPLVFKKGDNISEFPSGMMPIFDHYNISDSIDDCGMRGRLTYTGSFNTYCDSSQNMMPFDGFGTSYTNMTYKSEFGITSENVTFYGPPQDYPYNASFLTYSIIDGVLCGDQFFLGQNEMDRFDFKVFPNPANNNVSIWSETQAEEIILLDLQGKILRTYIPSAAQVDLDISEFKSGIYFIQLKSQGKSSIQKFVKE